MATPDYPRVYLDYMASTPIDETVLDAMLPWLRAAENPHSRHDLGQRGHEAVEKARSQIAALIGADRLTVSSSPQNSARKAFHVAGSRRTR